jgi:hypothetical protein
MAGINFVGNDTPDPVLWFMRPDGSIEIITGLDLKAMQNPALMDHIILTQHGKLGINDIPIPSVFTNFTGEEQKVGIRSSINIAVIGNFSIQDGQILAGNLNYPGTITSRNNVSVIDEVTFSLSTTGLPQLSLKTTQVQPACNISNS